MWVSVKLIQLIHIMEQVQWLYQGLKQRRGWGGRHQVQ